MGSRRGAAGAGGAGSTEKGGDFCGRCTEGSRLDHKRGIGGSRRRKQQEAMKKAEEMMRELQTQQKSIAEEAKGRKRAAGGAVEREGRSGKPTKKGQHLLPQKSPKRAMAIGYR